MTAGPVPEVLVGLRSLCQEAWDLGDQLFRRREQLLAGTVTAGREASLVCPADREKSRGDLSGQVGGVAQTRLGGRRHRVVVGPWGGGRRQGHTNHLIFILELGTVHEGRRGTCEEAAGA